MLCQPSNWHATATGSFNVRKKTALTQHRFGEYDLTNEKLQDNTGVLPPKSSPSVIPENWEPPEKLKTPTIQGRTAIPYGGFGAYVRLEAITRKQRLVIHA